MPSIFSTPLKQWECDRSSWVSEWLNCLYLCEQASHLSAVSFLYVSTMQVQRKRPHFWFLFISLPCTVYKSVYFNSRKKILGSDLKMIDFAEEMTVKQYIESYSSTSTTKWIIKRSFKVNKSEKKLSAVAEQNTQYYNGFLCIFLLDVPITELLLELWNLDELSTEPH